MSVRIDCGLDYAGFKAVVTAVAGIPLIFYNLPPQPGPGQPWIFQAYAVSITQDSVVAVTQISVVPTNPTPGTFAADFPGAVAVSTSIQTLPLFEGLVVNHS